MTSKRKPVIAVHGDAGDGTQTTADSRWKSSKRLRELDLKLLDTEEQPLTA